MTPHHLSLGWQTEFILHRLDARLNPQADCIAVCTDSNPTFYWGNCLVLPVAPADDDLSHWLARFEALVAQGRPEVRHVAIGVDAPRAGLHLPAWVDAGFQINETAVLALPDNGLCQPARAVRAGHWLLRLIDWSTEIGAFVNLQSQDCHPYEPTGYRAYRRLQMARYARLAQAGQAQWFGLWCDGTLAADCGLIRDAARPGALGRFQTVQTHPAWRRRGLCSALVHGVSTWGQAHWQLAQTVMCADPHDVAVRIYRSLGFEDVGASFSLQRNAPADGGQAVPARIPPVAIKS